MLDGIGELIQQLTAGVIALGFPVWLRGTCGSHSIVEVVFVVDLVAADQLAGGGVVDLDAAITAAVGGDGVHNGVVSGEGMGFGHGNSLVSRKEALVYVSAIIYYYVLSHHKLTSLDYVSCTQGKLG